MESQFLNVHLRKTGIILRNQELKIAYMYKFKSLISVFLPQSMNQLYAFGDVLMIC